MLPQIKRNLKKQNVCYITELEFNIKPIGSHWWVLILGDKLLYSSHKMIILVTNGLTEHFKRT